MVNLSLIAKRQGLALAYKAWINSATGSFPNSRNLENGIKITFKPGQAKKMSDSIIKSMGAKSAPDDLNVSLPWGQILLPVVFKKYWYYMAGGVISIYLLGKYT